MDITGYIERLRGDLVAAAATGGEAMIDAAERLATSLDAAVRMSLLEALSDAAAEITAALDGTSVEVRLRGRDPDLVVTVEDSARRSSDAFAGSGPPPPGGPDADGVDAEGDAIVARITLRIPESLKQRAESAAAAVRQSLNTWLVDAVRSAADGEHPGRRSDRRGATQLSGWVR